MRRLAPRPLHQLVRLHRLLAVALCLLLTLWPASGIVLSFVPFPSLSESARVAGREPVDVRAVRVSPLAALHASAIAAPQGLRLLSVAGQPRYLVDDGAAALVAIDARTGAQLPWLDAGAARTVVERFAGGPVRTVSALLDYDLWTVHDKYRKRRPYYRVALDDAPGTELYVSALTGEVMQRTDCRERGWNRVGASLHWLNVPALRVRAALWRWTVWTLALAGMLLLIVGLVLGVQRWRAQRRTVRGGLSPFRGLLRWHHTLGLVAGLLLLGWLGSGWLSLELNGWFSSPTPDAAQLARYRGLSLEEVTARVPLSSLASQPAAREYAWDSVGGTALVRARGSGDGRDWMLSGASNGNGEASLLAAWPQSHLVAAIASAWPGVRPLRISRVAADDAWSLRDEPLPPATLRVELDDAARTWVHVDARSGELLGVMDRSRRVYRWLVDGLHRFDFPPLDRSGLWHPLLVAAAATAAMFSLSGVWLAWRRLRRGTLLR